MVNKSWRLALTGTIKPMVRRVTDTVNGKPKGKRQLGIHKRRWEDNIKGDREVI
jgi:hypothetical protein